MSHTLVTGFLSFGRFAENPSAAVASACPRHELLEVSFAAVDAFIERAARDESFNKLLLLGVCGHATGMQLEQTARNVVGNRPDVRAHVLGHAPIDPAGPDLLPTTLWTDPLRDLALRHWSSSISHDAGDYVCNYVYYRALQHLPHKRVGFLHVPPVHLVSLNAQMGFVSRLLDQLID